MANTGNLLQTQIDINPNSPTYNTTRVVSAGVNLGVCPLPVTFASALISEAVTKSDCPAGQFGSTVIYTVPQGAYTSTVSQADADSQARAHFDATKQTYANTNGACSFTPPPDTNYEPVYYGSGPYKGCFSCTMRLIADPTQTRPATEQEISDYTREDASAYGATRACILCS